MHGDPAARRRQRPLDDLPDECAVPLRHRHPQRPTSTMCAAADPASTRDPRRPSTRRPSCTRSVHRHVWSRAGTGGRPTSASTCTTTVTPSPNCHGPRSPPATPTAAATLRLGPRVRLPPSGPPVDRSASRWRSASSSGGAVRHPVCRLRAAADPCSPAGGPSPVALTPIKGAHCFRRHRPAKTSCIYNPKSVAHAQFLDSRIASAHTPLDVSTLRPSCNAKMPCVRPRCASPPTRRTIVGFAGRQRECVTVGRGPGHSCRQTGGVVGTRGRVERK